MADTSLTCRYVDHQSKEIESLCINTKCEKMKPACLDCLRFYHHDHMDDIIDFTQFDQMQKDYSKMIDQIKSLFREIELIVPILRQILIEHQFEYKGLQNFLNVQQLNELICKIIPWISIHSTLSNDLIQLNSILTQLKSKLKKINTKNKIKQQITDNKVNQNENQSLNPSNTLISHQNTKVIQHQSIQYELVSEELQNEQCNTIAFNSDSNIMVAACGFSIKIFAFEEERLKEIQIIKQHKSVINSLQFFKKQNQFISASNDNQIIHWGQNNEKIFQLLQVFMDGHKNWVYCIIINKAEDLIISGSDDKTIKFWQRLKEWKCVQTFTEHKGYKNNQFLVEEITQFLSVKSQVINGKQFTKQKFLFNDLFIFQPNEGEKMRIYQFNKSKSQYVKINGLQLKKSKYEQPLFPSIYDGNKEILLHRFGQIIYLIKRKNKAEFKIEQSIQFGTDCVYGTITQNWEYMVTWDQQTYKFQVRKKKE